MLQNKIILNIIYFNDMMQGIMITPYFATSSFYVVKKEDILRTEKKRGIFLLWMNQQKIHHQIN